MATRKVEKVETISDVANAAAEATVKRDQDAIARWQAAASEAGTAESAAELFSKYEAAKAIADKAHEDYARAAARRALVYGWGRIATEQGVSPKQLHSWHKTFLANEPDLSAIPEKEMQREQRRIARLEKKLESEQALREEHKQAKARLTLIKEGMEP